MKTTQEAALDRLKEVLSHPLSKDAVCINTGVNTRTLARMQRAGIIKAAHIWLRGKTSTNLEIIP